MYPRQNRLRKTKEFDKVFRSSLRVKSGYFAIIANPNNLPNPRFGIIVSKKVGKAHTRNLIKRRIREIIRVNLARIPTLYDYVIVTYPQIADIDFDLLSKEILRCFAIISTKKL
jgi:ribonuclease P protein component